LHLAIDRSRLAAAAARVLRELVLWRRYASVPGSPSRGSSTRCCHAGGVQVFQLGGSAAVTVVTPVVLVLMIGQVAYKEN
jgi:hypothetical protein